MTSTIEETAGHKFQVFHPFSTYSDPSNKAFIDINGKPFEEMAYGYRELFTLGRTIYELFETIESKVFFDLMMVNYEIYVLDLKKILIYWNEVDALRINSDNPEDLNLEELERHQIVSMAWQVFPQTGLADDLEFMDAIGMVHALQAFIEIDSVLFGAKYGDFNETIYSAIQAKNCVNVALSINSGEYNFNKIRKSFALKGAMEKLSKDPKQKEKKFIKECWKDWQSNLKTYAGKAAFARDMLTKCEHLKSQKKIEDWCRDWESDAHPASSVST